MRACWEVRGGGGRASGTEMEKEREEERESFENITVRFLAGRLSSSSNISICIFACICVFVCAESEFLLFFVLGKVISRSYFEVLVGHWVLLAFHHVHLGQGLLGSCSV